MIRVLLKSLIRAYAVLVSPFLPRSCPFYPTCSAYAVQALDKHGALKGLVLMIIRLSKCHPLTRKGFLDPVPEAFDWPGIFRYKRGVCMRPECTHEKSPMSSAKEQPS